MDIGSRYFTVHIHNWRQGKVVVFLSSFLCCPIIAGQQKVLHFLLSFAGMPLLLLISVASFRKALQQIQVLPLYIPDHYVVLQESTGNNVVSHLWYIMFCYWCSLLTQSHALWCICLLLQFSMFNKKFKLLSCTSLSVFCFFKQLCASIHQGSTEVKVDCNRFHAMKI